MKNYLLIYLILFGTSQICLAQKSGISNSKWLSHHHHFIKFGKSSAHISDLDFIRSYIFSDSTIEFIHDYSHIVSKTEGNRKVPRTKFEVPYSSFKILHFSNDSLILRAKNPTAYYVATLINNPRTGLNEELFIKWNRSGKKPNELRSTKLDSIIILTSYLNSKNPRHITEIKMNTSCFAYNKYYTDIFMDSTGLLKARSIQQSYKDGAKPKILLFERQLDAVSIEKLDSLLSYSSINNDEVVSCKGSASHATNVDLKIQHTKGNIQIIGIRSRMNEMTRALFDFIDRLINEDYIVNELNFYFTNSKYN